MMIYNSLHKICIHISILIILIGNSLFAQENCLTCESLNFTFPNSICRGEIITFVNTSVSCTEPLNFNWDFGDGSPTSINASHTYTNNGAYNVKLFIPSKLSRIEFCSKDNSLHLVKPGKELYFQLEKSSQKCCC